MIEIGTALQIAVAVAMPFVIYILHGIRQNVHELRNQLQPLVAKVGVHDAEVANLKRRLELAEDAAR